MIDLSNPPFSTGHLTTLPNNPVLDLNSGIGQSGVTYRFKLTNGVTGEQLGYLTPIRNASLSHDTTRTIKRQMSLTLGLADAARVDPLTARVEPIMVTSDGTEWSLGRYVFTDISYQDFTAGSLANAVLNDEMFVVDQQITEGIDGGLDQNIEQVILQVMKGLPFTLSVEGTIFEADGMSWASGTNRGPILESLALNGDYFSPWFSNDRSLNFIRAFNPVDKVPDFDFDNGRQVMQASVMRSSDILLAPNRFTVISNTMDTFFNNAITATVDVPPTAPNSFANRGFLIPLTVTVQASTGAQATAIAKNLAQRNQIFERINLTTAPDPRHDSYNVILWQGSLWLELAWTLNMTPGGAMTHLIRKGYADS